jgi:hypothetical protein
MTMFILISPGKRRWANGSKGAPDGPARDEREQRPHHPGRPDSHRFLLAAHPAGDAGRVPVRVRHLQHRFRAELRTVQPARAGAGLPGLGGLAGRGRRSDPGRPDLGSFRPQEAAGRGRGHLRPRRDLVRGDAGRRRAAHRADADRAGHRRGLRHRDRLHRRVRAEEPARIAEPAAAVDDHRRDPDLLHRRADHLQRLPRQRGYGRLATGPRPRRRPGAGRAGAAHPDAGIAPVAAPARALRGRAEGDGRARHRGQHGGRPPRRPGPRECAGR